MALPSQMQSSPVRGRYVYRRRRRRRGPALLILTAVVAIGLITWLAIEWDESSSMGTANKQASGVNTRPNTAVTSSAGQASSSRMTRRTPGAETPVETSARWIPDEPLATSFSSQVPETQPAEEVVVTVTEAVAAPPPVEIVQTGTPQQSVPAESNRGGPLGLAEGLIGESRLVEARALLTQALDSGALSLRNAADARQLLGMINAELVFGPSIYPNDPWASEYVVKPGDSLSRIVSSENLEVDWRLLQLINGLKRPEHIQVGQTLKVLHGPFHASINKATHSLDLYMGEGPERTFVRTYDVGLGAMSSTPLGRFQVRKGSKLVNPTWTNPRTGQFYPADDPENPIGEYWMGLRGMDEANGGERGFGIHGTIHPGSIGTDSSMGCVRLRDGEIDMIYAVMAEGVSTIDVHR